MRKRVYGKWIEPDLIHAGLAESEPEQEAINQDRDCYRRSSGRAPDPLSVMIAAESGRPILAPLFPILVFTPQSPCPHYGPIPRGSVQCCMVCHVSGLDHHEAIRLKPGDLPEPDPTNDPPAPTKCESRTDHPDALTRKQRRALEFALRGASEDGRDDPRPRGRADG